MQPRLHKGYQLCLNDRNDLSGRVYSSETKLLLLAAELPMLHPSLCSGYGHWQFGATQKYLLQAQSDLGAILP